MPCLSSSVPLHAVQAVGELHLVQVSKHGWQLPSSVSANWPTGQKAVHDEPSSRYGVIEVGAHDVQLAASLGAAQLPQEGAHGRQCFVALGAKPAGHAARHEPRNWSSRPEGESAEHEVQLSGPAPSQLPQPSSHAAHAPLESR